MGQVFRRIIINVGIHKQANGCTVCQKAPEWLGYLVSTDLLLGSVPLWRQCCSAFWEQAYISAGLRFFFSFLWEKKCAGCVSRSALKLLWWPLLYWFAAQQFCDSVSFFYFFNQYFFFFGGNACYHVWMGSVIATVEEVLEHDMQNPLVWWNKDSAIHNSVHNSRGRVHDWNQALRISD